MRRKNVETAGLSGSYDQTLTRFLWREATRRITVKPVDGIG